MYVPMHFFGHFYSGGHVSESYMLMFSVMALKNHYHYLCRSIQKLTQHFLVGPIQDLVWVKCLVPFC